MTVIHLGASDWATLGMDTDTWEGRMAIKAAQRRGIADAEALLVVQAAPSEPPIPPPYGLPIG